MKLITDELMQKNLIGKLVSPWCSPAFLVGKPEATSDVNAENVHKFWRKVVDYTAVNHFGRHS